MVGAILAAGSSRRFGQCKLLYEIEGRSLLQRVVDELPFEKIYVVFGREEIPALIRDPRIVWIHNPDHEEGMGSSLRRLGHHLRDLNAPVLLTLGDLPFVSRYDYRQLIAAYDDRPLTASFQGAFGPPCILPPKIIGRLQEMSGDKGAKSLLKSAQRLEIPSAAWDIDEPESLARFRQLAGQA